MTELFRPFISRKLDDMVR